MCAETSANRAGCRRPGEAFGDAGGSEAPAWPPGTRHGYHAITLGWYESELIRRTDPAGRTLGRFLADEIAGPLGLDLHIGLPESVDRDRVAQLHGWSRAEALLHLNVDASRDLLAASFNPARPARPCCRLPRDVDAMGRRLQPRRRARHRDPVGQRDRDSRAVAQLYGAAATGDAALGLTADRARRADGRADRTEPRMAGQGAARQHRLLVGTVKAGAASACSDRPTKPSAHRGSAARSASPTPTPESASAT